MNKMVFAFDEARAKRDGLDPAALWAMVDGWVDECVKTHHGEYKKEPDPEGGVAYIGLGHETDWWRAFFGVTIQAYFSKGMAKYCSKWEWYYDEDEVDEQYAEDVLGNFLEKNDFYRMMDRA